MIPITDDEYKKVLYHIRTVLVILHYDIKLTNYTWLPPHLGCLLFIRKISKAGSAKSNKIRSLGDRNYQHKYCLILYNYGNIILEGIDKMLF